MEKPFIRLMSDGAIRMDYTREARDVERRNKNKNLPNAFPGEIVRRNAVVAIRTAGGDASNEMLVLGQHRLQFGQFRGETFKWLVENGLGYAAWIIANMVGEKEGDEPLSQNKFQLEKYVQKFPEGRQAVEMKMAEKTTKVKKPVQPKASPKISPRKASQRSKDKREAAASQDSELGDVELMQLVVGIEAQEIQTTPRSSQALEKTGLPLPDGWKQSLPKADHKWVANALFRFSTKGKPEMDMDKVDRLWWYPPQPSLICNQAPRVDRYFAQRLFLWMPRKMWQVRLVCPNEGCDGRELTNCGIYRYVRQVVDVTDNYSMAGEYLECRKCTRKVISWNHAIVKQLDIGHRGQFPAILTYRLGCDVDVIKLLRQRGLGNSSTQLQKKGSRSRKYSCTKEHTLRTYPCPIRRV